MIHEVDILHHLFGPIVRVHAEATPRQRGHAAEEGAAIILKFASGAVGTFILSDAIPSPYSFEAGTGENPMIPHTGQDFYRIFGTQASLSVPDMHLWSYASGKKSWTENMEAKKIEVADMKVPFELQVAHFVKVIRGEEQPSCSGKDGLRAVVVCEAIKKALKDGGMVDIAEQV
jgi:predicted dehydrogenase